jgi:hypothetical protein
LRPGKGEATAHTRPDRDDVLAALTAKGLRGGDIWVMFKHECNCDIATFCSKLLGGRQ